MVHRVGIGAFDVIASVVSDLLMFPLENERKKEAQRSSGRKGESKSSATVVPFSGGTNSNWSPPIHPSILAKVMNRSSSTSAYCNILCCGGLDVVLLMGELPLLLVLPEEGTTVALLFLLPFLPKLL